MSTVKVRKFNDKFQVYEKETGRIVFRAASKDECFAFLANQRKYSFEASEKKGIHYVY